MKGLPPKIPGKVVILEMRNHPTTIGVYNDYSKQFVIASTQCECLLNEPFDCIFSSEWIDDKDITGWRELE